MDGAVDNADSDLDILAEGRGRLNNVMFRRVTEQLEETRDRLNDTRVTELEDIAANIDEILEELGEIDATNP